MSDNVPDRELAALETALKGLVPAAGSFDRDQLFFRAGETAARSRRWFWPSTAAVLAVVACGLGTLLVLQPGPQTVERVVYIRVPVKQTTPQPLPPQPPPHPQPEPEVEPSVAVTVAPVPLFGGYLRLRDQALRWGVETLPNPAAFPTNDQPLRATSVLDLLSAKS